MQSNKEKNPNLLVLLLQWAGPERKWLLLSILCAFSSGVLTVTSYVGLYQLMDAVISGSCTRAIIAANALLITGGTVVRLVLLACAGTLSHKGAYRALFRVRCMVTEHLAKVPLGALDAHSIGDVKTVLNEDIEKLELCLAHTLPELWPILPVRWSYLFIC